MMSRKTLLKCVKLAWLLLIFVGLIWFVKSQDWTLIFKERGLGLSCLAVLAIVMAHWGVVLSQGEAIAACGTRIHWKDNLRIFNLANLSKYIPIGGANLAVNAVLIKQTGLTTKRAGAALTLAIIWTIIGAFIFGVPAAAAAVNLPVVPLTCVAFACWICVFFYRPERILGFNGSYTPAYGLIGQTLIWLGYGTAFSLVMIKYITSLPHFVTIGSAYDLSFGVGYLAVFAPSGIGVREVVTAFALPELDTNGIIAATLYLRVLILGADLIFGAMATAIYSKHGEKPYVSD